MSEPNPHKLTGKQKKIEKSKKNNLASLRNKTIHGLEKKVGQWSEDEHEIYLKCYAEYGPDWKRMEKEIHHRTAEQIRSHSQKFEQKQDRIKQKEDERLNAEKMIEIKPNGVTIRKKERKINYKEQEIGEYAQIHDLPFNTQKSHKRVDVEKKESPNELEQQNQDNSDEEKIERLPYYLQIVGNVIFSQQDLPEYLSNWIEQSDQRAYSRFGFPTGGMVRIFYEQPDHNPV